MNDFRYVCIVESKICPGHFYVGRTEDLRARLAKHNAGAVPHSAKLKPWRIKTAIAFTDRAQAAAFEAYLQTGSGRAFAKKRL